MAGEARGTIKMDKQGRDDCRLPSIKAENEGNVSKPFYNKLSCDLI